VVIRNLGTENMMLCQTCSNIAERCRNQQKPVGSSSSSGGSVETRSSCQEMPAAAADPQRQMHVSHLGGSGTSLSGSRGDTSGLVTSLLKRMPKLPVKHGEVDTTGSEFSHYMATIIQLATELNDVPRGGDSEGGFYLAQVLRYIQNNPNVPLKDVPHLSRTRGAEGRNPDGILYQVLHQGLSAIWDIIPT